MLFLCLFSFYVLRFNSCFSFSFSPFFAVLPLCFFFPRFCRCLCNVLFSVYQVFCFVLLVHCLFLVAFLPSIDVENPGVEAFELLFFPLRPFSAVSHAAVLSTALVDGSCLRLIWRILSTRSSKAEGCFVAACESPWLRPHPGRVGMGMHARNQRKNGAQLTPRYSPSPVSFSRAAHTSLPFFFQPVYPVTTD